MDLPVDRSVIKVSVVAIVTAVLGGLFGYYANQWLTGIDGSLLTTVIIGMVFLAALLLESLFIHSATLLGGSMLGQGIVMTLTLFWGATLSTTLFGFMTITLVLMVMSSRRGQSYMTRVLDVSIRELGVAMLPLMITALALAITVRYVGVNTDKEFSISKESAVALLKPGESAVKLLVPNFSFEMSLGEFVRQNAELIVKQQLGILPEAARRELVSQAEWQLTKTVSDMLGVAASPKTAIVEILQRAANDQLAKIPSAWYMWIRIGFGLFVFITIKGVGSLLSTLVVWLAWAVYKVLLMTGFARIGYEERQKEIVVL